MHYGYTGKILRVNLTEKETMIEEKCENFYRTYVGGKGFIAYFLLKEIPPGVDPLSADNKLIFATGILTGTPAAGMPRFAVGAKSPLTGAFGQSEAGGFFGPELKKAGFDAIIIEGQSPQPVYLSIIDGQADIKPAFHLMGKETGETQALIRKELGHNQARIAQIGPAGENMVKYANITNDLKHFNGRNGMGAVMGSKNIKAIAVYGKEKLSFNDPEKIKSISKNFLNTFMDHPLGKGLYEYGTPGGVTTLNAAGILPTKNFKHGSFYGAQNISGERMVETILKDRKGCFACAINCKRVVEVNQDEFSVDSRYGGPEYETLAAFGSLLEIDDIELIAKANEFCNRYGLDTISAGAVIGFIMECFEKGIMTEADTDGLEVRFGNKDVLLKLLYKIAYREGIGDLLAEGVKTACEKVGQQSKKYALFVKGQEVPMHDPRGKVGVGLGYAVSENSTDHMVSAHDNFTAKEGFALDSVKPLGITAPVSLTELSYQKLRNYIYLQYWWSFFNMAGICYFGPAPRGAMPMKDVVELYEAATGWETSMYEIIKAGERAVNMARMYNIREGLNENDDILPERFFTQIENGPQKGAYIPEEEFYKAVQAYYDMMGWHENGQPRHSKLHELDLGWLA